MDILYSLPWLQALRVSQIEDLASCSEVLQGVLAEVVPGGEGTPGSGGVLCLSTAVSGSSASRACVCVRTCVCVMHWRGWLIELTIFSKRHLNAVITC